MSRRSARWRRQPTPRPRALAAVLLALAVAPWASSCGKPSLSSYCDAVKSNRDQLSKVSQGATSSTLDALPILRELRDRSPDDVRADWNHVVSAFERLQRAFDDAHVDPSSYDPKHPPAGLTADQRSAIAAAVAGITTGSTAQSWFVVQQEVRDVCQTPLTY